MTKWKYTRKELASGFDFDRPDFKEIILAKSPQKSKRKEAEKKDGVTLKNAEWIENLDVSLNFYRRTGKYDKKWIARLGNPTCLNVKKIESDTLQRLLSKIEDELFAVRSPNYTDKGGGSRAPEGNVSSIQDGIPSTDVHPTPPLIAVQKAIKMDR